MSWFWIKFQTFYESPENNLFLFNKFERVSYSFKDYFDDLESKPRSDNLDLM